MFKLADKYFPAPVRVDLKTALAWKSDRDWIYDAKENGERAELDDGILFERARNLSAPSAPASLNNCRLDGEWLPRARSFIAFDLKTIHGQDISNEPLWFRRKTLAALLREENIPWLKLIRYTLGDGGEFLENEIARGGEGVVAKNIHAPYGRDWFKAKRQETHDCIVLEIHPSKESARLGQLDSSGQIIERGWCPVRGGDGCAFWGNRAVDQLHIGDVVEITCQKIHVSGKFCEPRICKDEDGALKIRRDKPKEQCLP